MMLWKQVLENLFSVLAIEIVTLSQAVDCAKVADKLSESSQIMYRHTREVSPVVKNDRSLTAEIATLIKSLRGEDWELFIGNK